MGTFCNAKLKGFTVKCGAVVAITLRKLELEASGLLRGTPGTIGSALGFGNFDGCVRKDC